MRNDNKKYGGMDEPKFLQTARDRFYAAFTYDIDSRSKSSEDREFVDGNQWDPNARKSRESLGRPCLTINVARKMVETIVGDYDKSRIQFKVVPKDKDSKKSAELINKACIDIQNKCNAGYAYEWGFRMAVTSGRGFWRVLPKYDSDETFDMSPKVIRILDPLNVGIDPFCKEADFSDIQYGFVMEAISKDEFKAQYPDKDPNMAGPFFTSNQSLAAYNFYFTKTIDVCYVTEYFWIEKEEDTLHEILDKSEIGEAIGAEPYSVFSKEYKRIKAENKDIVELRKRSVLRKKVMWAKITNNQVLEEPVELPCEYIPIVFCPGIESISGDCRDFVSLIRDSKDPGRAYNYARSSSIENIGQTPKAPYLMTPDMIRGHESDWNNHNVSPKPYLLYNPDPMVPGGQPSKLPPPDVQAALTNEAQLSMQEMKSTSGIYDAAMGQVTNEVSARAIEARSSGTLKSNFAYFRALERAIIFTGKIFVSMMKNLAFDGREMMIANPMSGELEPVKIDGVDDGSFDVTIDTSPEYETQRKEVMASLSAYVHQSPRLAEIMSDIVAKSSDWPDSDKIADRVRRSIPINLLSPEEAAKRAFEDAEIEKMIMVARQSVLGQSQPQSQESQSDAMKLQMEMQKMQIELEKEKIQLEIQRMKAMEQAEKTKEAATLTAQEAQGHGFDSKAFERKMIQTVARLVRGSNQQIQEKPQENIQLIDDITTEGV